MEYKITHKQRPTPDFNALVNSYTDRDLASPSRSTVPLLAYWKMFQARAADYSKLLGVELAGQLHFGFEYTVPVAQGRGNASHTDLMIISSNHALANEAKYTEPAYETVQKWLGSQSSENRRLVLTGWLSLIKRATGRLLSINDVLGCTYQLIHRAASVCSLEVSKRSVVYMLFDPSKDQIEDCSRQLRPISALTGNPDKLDFRLMLVELRKSHRYLELQSAWKNGERHLSAPVRAGLLSGDLMEFGVQRLELI
jgi:hypothetical protein